MLGYDMTWATFAVVEAAYAMIIFTGWCPMGIHNYDMAIEKLGISKLSWEYNSNQMAI
jgi:hypothetical protein